MAFGFGKLAVLESKLDIYEDLSKEMLDKLERAVGTISENSQRVAIVLERHENRLEESDKTDKLLLKMFDEMKHNNAEDHKSVNLRIDSLEKKIDDLYKFRWIAVGIALAAVTILKAPDIFSSFLTPNQNASIVEMNLK
jgi:hypothetical protein